MSTVVNGSEQQAVLDRHVGVDYRVARRRVEQLSEVPSEIRQRAFARWVALFDLADGQFRVEVPSRRLIESLGGISRVTWTDYRAVLVACELLRVAVSDRGPRPQVLILTPPMLATS